MAYRGVSALHFWGERERPLQPSDLAKRNPILATAKPPAEIIERASRRSLYISVSSGEKPEVKVHQCDTAQGRPIYEIQIAARVEQFEAASSALPGKTAVRRPPEHILREIDPGVDLAGKRPDFLHQFFQPRTIPRIERRLRRFNGRRVVPTYVFGNDDRQPYEDTSYPWGCVGKIYNSDGFMGSGSLVYPDIVVTAGHMAPWNSIAQGSWWMRFVPDYFNGSSLYGAGVESYVSDVLGYNTNETVTGYDWAICKLYNPVGNTTGYFGFNGYSSDWENWNVWTVLGYPVGVASGEEPSWQGGITIHDDDGDSNGGDELESDNADVTPGDSGGPIFAWWGNDPRVVGVVSGQEEEYVFPFSFEDNNIFASGSGFTNLIAWGRSNWG